MQNIDCGKDDERIIGQACKIIAQLGRCERGQNEADEKNILPTIINLLFDEVN